MSWYPRLRHVVAAAQNDGPEPARQAVSTAAAVGSNAPVAAKPAKTSKLDSSPTVESDPKQSQASDTDVGRLGAESSMASVHSAATRWTARGAGGKQGGRSRGNGRGRAPVPSDSQNASGHGWDYGYSPPDRVHDRGSGASQTEPIREVRTARYGRSGEGRWDEAIGGGRQSQKAGAVEQKGSGPGWYTASKDKEPWPTEGASKGAVRLFNSAKGEIANARGKGRARGSGGRWVPKPDEPVVPAKAVAEAPQPAASGKAKWVPKEDSGNREEKKVPDRLEFGERIEF